MRKILQWWLQKPPTRNIYNWPPLFISWVMVSYHYLLALSLIMDPSVENLIIFGGLDKSLEYLGREYTIVLLAIVSSMTLIGLMLEYRLNWLITLLLITPQYLLITGGAGSHVSIFIQGEHAGQEFSRWVILGALGLFFCLAVGHTCSVLWRIKYWILVSQFHSEV